MTGIRKKHAATFKAKVALEAVKSEKTISQLASHYKVHATQIGQWKKQFLQGLPDIFSDKRKKKDEDRDALEERLYSQIGKQKVELDWLKKKSELLC